jgi:hypothetical protein
MHEARFSEFGENLIQKLFRDAVVFGNARHLPCPQGANYFFEQSLSMELGISLI